MGSELIIIPVIFGTIFGVFYLYFSTRNKERLALIEKGTDASIFVKGKKEQAAPIWKVLILNIALLSMGIGLGIVLGGILWKNLNVASEIAMPGSIFLMAGAGLLIGFFITKNLDKD
ncbi:hypothetical protein FEZ18_09580 [Oceanihabitans sp. IOP_32]|uniref:DUF6249 domain-containing protein n=1 Tax=Oceanihabitans sp. IOP_32 TaxID=2529032 RepID=UPI0012933EC4|nr:DUF6249 domain-containing protein [Oceanihabitans sp. IOP_32]QFZ55025.1 hypothetical protein FEZ18_09580 [Oceanihabitans sp. IOP_32]